MASELQQAKIFGGAKPVDRKDEPEAEEAATTEETKWRRTGTWEKERQYGYGISRQNKLTAAAATFHNFPSVTKNQNIVILRKFYPLHACSSNDLLGDVFYL